MKTIELKVATRIQDNGDGGFTAYCYNNTDELLADHPKAKDFVKDPVTGEWGDVVIELTQEKKDEILNNENDYENGYVGEDTITLNV
ncbi:hypothetical protein WB403_49155, partial [Streptomyces brasiliscabiei]